MHTAESEGRGVESRGGPWVADPKVGPEQIILHL